MRRGGSSKKEEEIEEEMEGEIRGSKNQKRDWIGAFILPLCFLLDFLNPE